LIEQGLFLYTHKHTVLIIPPLIITQEQLEDGFKIIDEGLQIVDEVLDI
jgi:taurine--2-oxoglutarate transaminase